MGVTCCLTNCDFDLHSLNDYWASQVMLVVKNLSASAGDLRDAGLIPGSGRSPGEGMATPSNILAWRIPWTEDAAGLRFIGLQRLRHNWSDWACMQWCSSVEHLFIGLLTICIFSLEKCLLKCFGHFFHRVVCFFVVVFPFLGKYIPCKQQQITHSGSTCFHPASVSAKPHPLGAVGSKAQRYLPCGAHSMGNRALMRGQLETE